MAPEILYNHRPVFVKKLEGQCIWWHEIGRWWMGPCGQMGGNSGFAYLDGLETCPFPATGGKWLDGTTNDPLSGSTTEQSGASDSNLVASSPQVEYTFNKGVYRSTCQWEYTNEGFKCLVRGNL